MANGFYVRTYKPPFLFLFLFPCHRGSITVRCTGVCSLLHVTGKRESRGADRSFSPGLQTFGILSTFCFWGVAITVLGSSGCFLFKGGCCGQNGSQLHATRWFGVILLFVATIIGAGTSEGILQRYCASCKCGEFHGFQTEGGACFSR